MKGAFMCKRVGGDQEKHPPLYIFIDESPSKWLIEKYSKIDLVFLGWKREYNSRQQCFQIEGDKLQER